MRNSPLKAFVKKGETSISEAARKALQHETINQVVKNIHGRREISKEPSSVWSKEDTNELERAFWMADIKPKK